MANLFDPTVSQDEQGFNPSVDNRGKAPIVSGFGKFAFYASFIFIFPIVYYVKTKNDLMRLQTNVNELASGIQIQLTKRADTLNKLVNQVKSYKEFEKSVLEDIAKLRSLANSGASVTENSGEIERLNSSVFGRLMAVVENYPDLKSSDLYKRTMEESIYIERELAASRRAYNATVNEFNQSLFTYPRSVIASNLRLMTLPLYQASAQQMADVTMENI